MAYITVPDLNPEDLDREDLTDEEIKEIASKIQTAVDNSRPRKMTDQEYDVWTGAVTRALSMVPSYRDAIAVLRPFVDPTAPTCYVDPYARMGIGTWFFQADTDPYQRATALLHEACHILYNHFQRWDVSGIGDATTQNYSGDFEINTGLNELDQTNFDKYLLPEKDPFFFETNLTMEQYAHLLGNHKEFQDMLNKQKQQRKDPNCPVHGTKKPVKNPSQDPNSQQKDEAKDSSKKDAEDKCQECGQEKSKDASPAGQDQRDTPGGPESGDQGDGGQENGASDSGQDGSQGDQGDGGPAGDNGNGPADSGSSTGGQNGAPGNGQSDGQGDTCGSCGQSTAGDGEGQDGDSGQGDSGQGGESGQGDSGDQGQGDQGGDGSGEGDGNGAPSDSHGHGGEEECSCPDSQNGDGQGGQGQGQPGEGQGGGAGNGLENYPCSRSDAGKESAADEAGIERASDSEQNVAKNNTRARIEEELKRNQSNANNRQPGSGHRDAFLQMALSRMQAPKVNWRTIFRRTVAKFNDAVIRGRSDYSYRRVSRRHASSEFIFPGMVKYAPKAMLAVDTSGSMSEEDFRKTLQEVEGILKAIGGKASLRAFSVDTQISGIQEVKSVKAMKLSGGGGTDMGAAFEYINSLKKDDRPDLAVLATDGYWYHEPVIEQLRLAKGKYKSIILVTTKGGYDEIPPELHALATVIDISEEK